MDKMPCYFCENEAEGIMLVVQDEIISGVSMCKACVQQLYKERQEKLVNSKEMKN